MSAIKLNNKKYKHSKLVGAISIIMVPGSKVYLVIKTRKGVAAKVVYNNVFSICYFPNGGNFQSGTQNVIIYVFKS